ncbi:MAG TPA: bifunctional glutamate N-acetyltransferase/amino-acid acetyltransferase ArgJ, partial [Acidiferrobacteraceae bacterium]|nr:bifunctional glutamate N-acetyltransferase/amino-acid acetyltransferase ArgJ [Acidiferrobacteraceae bacterium]
MAVNLKVPWPLGAVAGVRIGTVAAGIRKAGRPDLTLISLAPGTRVAGIFTRNQFCAAPVLLARRLLQQAGIRGLVVNTGYANAGTGADGLAAAQRVCAAAAAVLGCAPEAVLPFSTGIIGAPLPVDVITAALPAAAAHLTPSGWNDAAVAIMTTDTVPKGLTRTFSVGGTPVTVTGIAKGAGMIEPDMATLLAFVGTDAAVDDDVLADLLQEAAASSFNSMTVDGDTSTNDSCILFATGASGVALRPGSDAFAAFRAALKDVFDGLAQSIIRDAEGATKFVTVETKGARSVSEARDVAYAIARSPLVKTALFAQDANWGRVLAAAGRAVHAPLDLRGVTLSINGLRICTGGAVDPKYTDEAGMRVMRAADLHIELDFQQGAGTARVWTCDLSHEYVRINGDY